jgi:Glycogen recognition site of AMP-activated protein kinase
MATKKEVTPKTPTATVNAPKAVKKVAAAKATATKAEVKVKTVKAEVKTKAPKVVKVVAPKATVKAKATKVAKAAAPKTVKVAVVKAEVKPKTTKAPKAEVAPQVAPAKKAAASKSVKKVTFALPKEAVAKAKAVVLVGDFNNWAVEKSIALTKQKDGSFKTTVELESGKEYQYRFLLNGETWENAWDAPKYVSSPFGGDNSVVFA